MQQEMVLYPWLLCGLRLFCVYEVCVKMSMYFYICISHIYVFSVTERHWRDLLKCRSIQSMWEGHRKAFQNTGVHEKCHCVYMQYFMGTLRLCKRYSDSTTHLQMHPGCATQKPLTGNFLLMNFHLKAQHTGQGFAAICEQVFWKSLC